MRKKDRKPGSGLDDTGNRGKYETEEKREKRKRKRNTEKIRDSRKDETEENGQLKLDV